MVPVIVTRVHNIITIYLTLLYYVYNAWYGKYVLQSSTINNNNNVVEYYGIARTHNRNIAILAIVGLSLFI